VIAYNVGRELLLPVLTGIFVQFDAAFNRDQPAFGKVVGDKLRSLAPGAATEEVGLPLALLVLGPTIDGYGKVRDGQATGRVAHLGVARQAAHQNDFVQ
jgi:hypothetical protein